MRIHPLLGVLLWPLSIFYHAFVAIRLWLYQRRILAQKRLPGTVISVGNLTVGGTGKTPMVLWLAEHFVSEGKRVGILSRGYRGSGFDSDEIRLMQNRLGGRVAFGVGKDRFREGSRLAEKGIDLFLLDDGFQHLRVARDLDIVLVDATVPLEAQSLLPAGPLREPTAALQRADIVVMTRAGAHHSVEARDSHRYPIFYAKMRLLGFRKLAGDPNLEYLSEIPPGPFYAFCGIGNPEAFIADLKRWHVDVAGQRFFRDHYGYSAAEIRELFEAATRCGARGLVTTEKDAANCEGAPGGPLPIYVAVIAMEPNSESEFLAAIHRKLHTAGGANA